MNRFTERDKYDDVNIIGVNSARLYEELDYDEDLTLTFALNKFAYLEDIEEEIGISLIKLSKAKKNGAYVLYKQDKSIRFIEAKDINSIELDFFALNTTYAGFLYFSDYGKTWALTRQELEVEE